MIKIADIFNIQAYELLKPPNVLPDNYTNIMEKYTEDIHVAIEEIRNVYLLKLVQKV